MKAGSLRALGVSSAQRIADLPDVPTIAESGYPDYSVSVWYGISAPSKLPDDVAQKITASLERALNDLNQPQRGIGESRSEVVEGKA